MDVPKNPEIVPVEKEIVEEKPVDEQPPVPNPEEGAGNEAKPVEKEEFIQTVDMTKVRRVISHKQPRDGYRLFFSYEEKQYSVFTFEDDSRTILRNLIMKELNNQGYTLFLSDVDIQDDEYLASNNKYQLTKKGYVLPVVTNHREVEFAKDKSIKVANKNQLHKLFDDIHYGNYKNHTELEVVFEYDNWLDIKQLLIVMKYTPFPKLEHFTLHCKKPISDSYLTKIVSESHLAVLKDITIVYKTNGDPYDVVEKRKEQERVRNRKAKKEEVQKEKPQNQKKEVKEAPKKEKKDNQKKEEVQKKKTQNQKKEEKKDTQKEKKQQEKEKPKEEKQEEKKETPKKEEEKPKKFARRSEKKNKEPKPEDKPAPEPPKEAKPTPEEKPKNKRRRNRKAKTEEVKPEPEQKPEQKPKSEQKPEQKSNKPKRDRNQKPKSDRNQKTKPNIFVVEDESGLKLNWNVNAQPFIMPSAKTTTISYSSDPNQRIARRGGKSNYDDPQVPIDWQKDFNKVNFTRRFSISEISNPHETDATKFATTNNYPNNRKHRNINRNNVRQGDLPDFVQLIEDLKGNQSELRSIRVNRPILVDAICLFMETFIKANCSNINTLCLCSMDFTGVSCKLLKEFLECKNMRNLEVLSFMNSKLREEQLDTILNVIYNHHLDNLQDLNFEGVIFSVKNLQLLQKIVHDQILLKLWCIHMKNNMTEFNSQQLEIIKDIFNTINMMKMT